MVDNSDTFFSELPIRAAVTGKFLSILVAQIFAFLENVGSWLVRASKSEKPKIELARSQEPKFYGNYLSWEIDRNDRTFRVYVVEPDAYEPSNHSAIFNAALDALLAPKSHLLDPYDGVPIEVTESTAFDLLTFPEAFLPAKDLLASLDSLIGWPRFGCVHVGLRPSTDPKQHLFIVSELQELVRNIRTIPRVFGADLAKFSTWLDQQNASSNFNVGCVFTVDANSNIRICLHPKIVRSKYEVSMLQEHNMKEANLLSLVTLRPTNKNLKTVTLQPLLCSDALELSTDSGAPGPLQTVNQHAGVLGNDPPDHIDVVSVATCTPQPATAIGKGERHFIWHEQFRSSLVRAASSPVLQRHHHAAFVLSNFRLVSEQQTGGLSGTFMPVALREDKPPSFIAWSCWGRPNDTSENQWSSPQSSYEELLTWSSRAYLAYLNHAERRATFAGRMFGFTIQRFPRDIIPFVEKAGLSDCTHWVAIGAPSISALAFEEV